MIAYLKGIAPLLALTASELGIPDVKPTSGRIEIVLRFFFGLAGALAVLFIAIGGFRYTISSGDPSNVKQAKDTILYAVIGLVIALLAQFIIGFVISAV